MAVKSRPSCRPALRIASRLRAWVTRCVRALRPSAVASDQPTSGTLGHSGLAASAMISARTLMLSSASMQQPAVPRDEQQLLSAIVPLPSRRRTGLLNGGAGAGPVDFDQNRTDSG